MVIRAIVLDDTVYVAVPDLATVVSRYADSLESDDAVAAEPVREVVAALLDYALQAHQAQQEANG